MERTVGGNRHAYDGFWGYAATAEFPSGISDVFTLNLSNLLGSVVIIGPAFQLVANKDFRGMPIESAKDENISPRYRYTGSTSKLAKNIGNVLNWSPKMIDFYGNNTLGALWQYQKALFPVDDANRDVTLGVQGKYLKDSLYSQDVVNRFHDMAKESLRQSNDDKHNIERKITSYMDNDAMKGFYDTYNSLARNERNEEDETPDDRRVRDLVLTMIEEYAAAREDGFLTDEQKAVYEVCRKAGTTENLLPGARDPVITDGDGTVHNLTSAQYYDYQGNYNSLYWTLVQESFPQVGTDAEKQYLLKHIAKTALEMSKNSMLIRLGAKTTDEYEKFATLQLYSVPISTYLVAKTKTRDIEGLQDKRTKDTITNSKGALIAEAVREMELDLPETNLRMLMSKLGVGDTVLSWKESKLTRELKKFRKDAGVA